MIVPTIAETTAIDISARLRDGTVSRCLAISRDAARFQDELILGSKMTIESPVSESRSSPHSRESRLADFIGRELGACRFDNSLACLGGL